MENPLANVSGESKDGVSTPYAGNTVLELSGIRPVVLEDGRPPQTPPVPFQTHTRSGEGFAQITDDQDSEHLYE